MNPLPNNKPLKGARILIAEDNAILAFDLIGLLCEAGADVVGPACTIERALELSEAEPLTCCVLDVNLRDGCVFPAAEILRQRQIGIVFYTGYLDPNGLMRDWPGARVLPKPAPFHLLIQTIGAACHAAEKRSNTST